MKENKRGLIIGILVLLVLLLGGLVVYSFALKPAISGYAINAQNQGVQYAVYSIMLEAAKCQPVPLTFGNQTMNVVAVECLPPELFENPQNN
ncbi:MAG: hypothetical protein ABIH49_02070 [archaeon]